MDIRILGKELTVTEAIKEYVEKKLERIEKYFEGENISATVTIRGERSLQIAEIHINAKSVDYRAVTETKDLYASIDKDIDILEGQIRKEKTKRERMNKEDSIKLKEMNMNNTSAQIEDEVIKTMYYEIKPITVEDAKLKLKEKTGNIFLTFVNVETGKVNVIFRLKDSLNYGLIEPEI